MRHNGRALHFKGRQAVNLLSYVKEILTCRENIKLKSLEEPGARAHILILRGEIANQ